MNPELINDMTVAEPQEQLYSVEYFIRKFEATHEDEWCSRNYEDEFGGKCAYGHCGVVLNSGVGTPEAEALAGFLGDHRISRINDGADSRYKQTNPKARILAALRDVQARTV